MLQCISTRNDTRLLLEALLVMVQFILQTEHQEIQYLGVKYNIVIVMILCSFLQPRTERLRITSAGILQLDNGNQITAADTTTYLGLGGGNSTSNGANIFLYGASHASNASAFVFRTSTTERLRILLVVKLV